LSNRHLDEDGQLDGGLNVLRMRPRSQQTTQQAAEIVRAPCPEPAPVNEPPSEQPYDGLEVIAVLCREDLDEMERQIYASKPDRIFIDIETAAVNEGSA